MEEGLKFIRANKDRPFFCYLPITPPHGMYDIPADDPAWQLYQDAPWIRDPAITQDTKNYAAMVTMVDRNVRQVIDLLQELDLEDDTILFFTGDNGGQDYVKNFFQPNRHLRGFKRDIYDGGLRVPAVARWPGRIPAGTRSDLVWYFPDVMPTLSEIAGADDHLPERVDGLSIVPTLTGRSEQQGEHDFVYWEYRKVANWRTQTYAKDLAQAVRKGNFKAVRTQNDSAFELYDLAEDPGEKNNIAAHHPETVAALGAIAKREHEEPPPQDEPKAPGGKRFI